MKTILETILPDEIEKRSFEIITKELHGRQFDPLEEPIIKRCIHTSADFDYADNLCFSDHSVAHALSIIRQGCNIVTDTQMAKAGINKKKLTEFGGTVSCFMSDDDVAKLSKKSGTTRACASMKKAAWLSSASTENSMAFTPDPSFLPYRPVIFAIGNAPTALIELYHLMKERSITPALIIGVPVGFVNVVQAKELIMTAGVPYIVARGRKGGSNIAAAIVNALLYQA